MTSGAMKCPLAIFSPHIGNRTETFVRRHMCDLLPAQTAVVVKGIRQDPDAVTWDVPPPVMALVDHCRRGLKRQVLEAIGWQFGWEAPDPAMKAVKRFLREYEVEVLMGEYLDETLPYIDLAHELGIRVFAHAHGYDVSVRLRSEKWRDAYQKLNEADGIITVSEYSRKRLIAIGVSAHLIHVVPCSVEVPDAPPVCRDTPGEIRCLAVGRMTAKKGPIYLLDAFRRASVVYPNMRLDVIGDGELLDAARQYVDANELAGKICLHGSKPSSDVELAMKAADIFLQHSRTAPDTGDQEGLPVAILEAMAAALPVISTRHAGIPEAVDHGVTGFLSDEGDVKSMAENIVHLAENAAIRQKIGVAAWENARDNFSFEKERDGLLTALGLERLAMNQSDCYRPKANNVVSR